MEDKENSTTELFLSDNGLIEFGETDGPLWSEAEGRWHVEPGTDDFSMIIFRRFNTGSSSTDMGEFSYEIGRTYTGTMTKVGECVGITGVMHTQADEFGTPDQEVVRDNKKVWSIYLACFTWALTSLFAFQGYFNMIDGTWRTKCGPFRVLKTALVVHDMHELTALLSFYPTGTDIREDRRPDARLGVRSSS